MRLPYIQVTQETWEQARSLAALVNISEGDAFKLLCDLWRWGLTLGVDDAPPTGICASPRAPRLLAAAVGWKKEPSELVDALADLQLLEALDVGLRVRGTKRYAAAWEKAKKDRERKATASDRRRVEFQAASSGIPTEVARNSDGIPGESPGKTQIKTQTQIERESKATAEAALPPPPKAPDDPLADGFAFFAHVQHQRHANGLPREKPPHPAKLGAWWSEALMDLNGQAGALVDAYRGFVADEFWRGKSPPLPFPAFMSQWRKYVPARPVQSAH